LISGSKNQRVPFVKVGEKLPQRANVTIHFSIYGSGEGYLDRADEVEGVAFCNSDSYYEARIINFWQSCLLGHVSGSSIKDGDGALFHHAVSFASEVFAASLQSAPLAATVGVRSTATISRGF
jgi:hypothetical protein